MIKNISRQLISNFWGTLEKVTFDFTFKNGITKTLTHEVYGKSDGVAMLLYNKQTRQIILTKQFRAPVLIANFNNGFLEEVCGGAIDTDENPLHTVIREAKEEVGYTPKNISSLGWVFLTPGIVKEKVYLFLGEFDEKEQHTTGGLFDEDEQIDILKLSFEDAFSKLDSHQIYDARTVILLQHLKSIS